MAVGATCVCQSLLNSNYHLNRCFFPLIQELVEKNRVFERFNGQEMSINKISYLFN